METNIVKGKKIAGLILALLYIYWGVRRLVILIDYSNFFSSGLLWVIAWLLFAVYFILDFAKGRREYLLPIIALGLMTIGSIAVIASGFRNGLYIVSSYRNNGFNVFAFLTFLAEFAAYALAAAFVYFLSRRTGPVDKAEKLWFFPSALLAGAQVFTLLLVLVIEVLMGNWWVGGYAQISTMLKELATAAAVFSVMTDFVDVKINVNKRPAKAAAPRSGDKMYKDLFWFVILLILTCGIWYFIWIYRVTSYLNRQEDEPYRSPVATLLLCLFIPFYLIYWEYRTAQRIDKLAAGVSVPSKIALICLVLNLIFPHIPPIIIQDRINAIVTAEKSEASGDTTSFGTKTVGTGAAGLGDDAFEQLKRYKELLDLGIINEEEFEARKSRILGMNDADAACESEAEPTVEEKAEEKFELLFDDLPEL